MKKRIFISFAKEDSNLRDLLVGQARNDDSPFDFTDMSVKKPWDNAWKTNCRTKIKGCDGLIAIITSNTQFADGEKWEINCAMDEKIPCIGIWGHNTYHTIPSGISGIKVMDWEWDNIASWIKKI